MTIKNSQYLSISTICSLALLSLALLLPARSMAICDTLVPLMHGTGSNEVDVDTLCLTPSTNSSGQPILIGEVDVQDVGEWASNACASIDIIDTTTSTEVGFTGQKCHKPEIDLVLTTGVVNPSDNFEMTSSACCTVGSNWWPNPVLTLDPY